MAGQEKIEAWYTKVRGFLPVWHKTLVYTRKDGTMFAIRVGPVTDPITGKDICHIETSYEFTKDKIDYPDPGESYGVEEIISGDDLDSILCNSSQF